MVIKNPYGPYVRQTFKTAGKTLFFKDPKKAKKKV